MMLPHVAQRQGVDPPWHPTDYRPPPLTPLLYAEVQPSGIMHLPAVIRLDGMDLHRLPPVNRVQGQGTNEGFEAAVQDSLWGG